MLIKLELNLNRRERWKETLDFMDCLSLNVYSISYSTI